MADHPRSFAFEAVSQLDSDASSALATIREWKNSFALINRIPTDIISLIPTYLASQKDRIRAASMCRHWRGVLLRNCALWSQMFLIKGEECVSILLERAKGSALDIIAHHDAPPGTMTLIFSRAQQIRSLEFTQSYWMDVIKFSESIPGRLPLLRILEINTHDTYSTYFRPGVMTPPPPPLFSGSTNLEHFVFRSRVLPFLGSFVFPNLTTFKLSAYTVVESSASYLLDFLKASPTLETVKVEISPRVVLGGVPQEMVVVLPNVKSFSLQVTHDPTGHIYDLAAHISCPRARDTSLAHGVVDTHMGANVEMFPTPDSWCMIARQYTAGPIEEVTLEIERYEFENIECSLTFRTSSTAVLRSGFEVIETGVDESEVEVSHEEISWEIFYQALTTIQGCPLLSRVKRLRIRYIATLSAAHGIRRIGSRVRELFSSLGPLDELTIHHCDLHVFLANFDDDLGNYTWEQPIVLPQIKELVISHPMMEVDEEACLDAVVELAKSQHARGIPFERLTIHMWDLPARIGEELMPWVGTVDCDWRGGPGVVTEVVD